MNKVTSFDVDHDKHFPGFYLMKEQSIDGAVIYTYDLRFKKPNGGDYLSIAVLHSIEHMLATTLRDNDKGFRVINFSPMGCRTGFEMMTAGIATDEAKKLLIDGLEKALKLQNLPGATRKECGNYLEHDLQKAKEEMQKYYDLITA